MSLPIHVQARTLVGKYGMHLVEIPKGSKAPLRPRWQTETISTPEAAEAHWLAHPDDNLGVVLGPSHLCSIDVDDAENTRIIFSEFGIDIDAYAQLYTSCQGNPARFKIFFRVPEDMAFERHVISWPRQDDPSKRSVVFEIRSGSGQDVLPPSTHPEGYPYTWICKPNGSIAPIPPELLTIVQNWDVFKKNAAALCPWAPKPEIQERAPKPAIRDGESVIEAWNAAHDLESELVKYGYTKHGRRYLSPHSGTKLPGVSILPDGQRCWIHHASDPLCSEETGQPVGAFDLYLQCEYGGNITSAVRDAADFLGMKPKRQEPLVSDFHPDIIEPREGPRFVFQSAEALVAEPAPTDWLLQGWFERNTLAMYFGDPGSCKTWLALSQAVHIAMGAPWFGSKVQQGAVFILCGEGHRGFRRRLEGIRQFHNFDYAGAPLYVSAGPANLIERESVNDVLIAVQDMVERTGAAPVLVVVDTVSRNYGAGDENSTSDMANFINSCDRLRAAYGCAILLVHHSGHGDKNRGRGSSVLRAALDTEFRMAKDADSGAIEATCTKAKDFEAPDPRHYRLAHVHLNWPPGEDGLPVTSAAIEPSVAEPEAPKAASYLGPNQAKGLSVLQEEFAASRNRLSAAGKHPFGARVAVQEWRLATGFDRRRFDEVKRGLEHQGRIRVDGIYVFLEEESSDES